MAASDTPPEMDETLKSLDQAIEDFRRIKEELKLGAVQEVQGEIVPTVAASTEPETTT